MEALSFDNILGENEIETLFTDPEDTEVVDEPTHTEEEEVTDTLDSDKPKEKNKTTEVVDPETLFEEETPESVGSGKDKEGKEDTVTDEEPDGTSPNDNFYSSIAKTFAEDGVFQDLNDEALSKVNDAESFILDSFFYSLTHITIGSKCFRKVKMFGLDGLSELESVVIGEYSFGSSDDSCRIVNCPKLKSIQIGDGSFRNYQTFELNNLPSLHFIGIGVECFSYAPSFSLTGLIDGLV